MDCFWTDHLSIHVVLNPRFCGGKLHGQILKTVLIRWRSISDKQREKEQERARVNRQSISDKQREKEQERARVNRQSVSDKQREKEHEQTG